MSRISFENSTQRPLAAGATFTGDWDSHIDEHVLYNVIADAPGTIYIDFAVSEPLADGPEVDWAFRTVYTSSQPILGAEPRFRSLIKGPGRAFRLRYVNGSTPQTYFNLLASTGDNLFPSSASEDGELLITEAERERDVFVSYMFTAVSADSYAILVDLSDTTNFPHDRTGRVDVTNSYILVDRDANAVGAARFGVITRINGTNADIAYVAGVTFEKSAERFIVRDRKYSPSQLKCGVEDGALNRILTSTVETNIAAINTATPLDSALGTATVTPAVGDIIMKCTRSAGTFGASFAIFYHGEDTA